jgi:selenocysteine lyase/cysteine desulfurase
MVDVRALWPRPVPGYLNTASYGLPSQPAVAATLAWLQEWQDGRPYDPWVRSVEQARELLGELIGMPADRIATGSSAAQLVGLVAASVPDGSLVLTPELEFTSLIAPFQAQVDRGVRVEVVPGDRLAEAAAERGDVIAFSLVRSLDGVRVDDEAIVTAARGRGALTVVDAAQAVGWLDVDFGRFEVVVATAFKWLACPRGSAFMFVAPSVLGRLRPSLASWFSSEDEVPGYASTLRLPTSAKRLDTTPVWSIWPGTAAALGALTSIGLPAINALVLGLARRLRTALALPPEPPTRESAIVLLTDPTATARLSRAGLATTQTPAGTRLSFHVYNTEADVDRALTALTPA